MIHLGLRISNPFWRSRWANIKSWVFDTPSKWHQFEIQIMRCDDIVNFEFSWTRQQDHAGIDLALALLGIEIAVRLYDVRHWDYEHDRWESYDN